MSRMSRMSYESRRPDLLWKKMSLLSVCSCARLSSLPVENKAFFSKLRLRLGNGQRQGQLDTFELLCSRESALHLTPCSATETPSTALCNVYIVHCATCYNLRYSSSRSNIATSCATTESSIEWGQLSFPAFLALPPHNLQPDIIEMCCRQIN